MEAAEHTGVQTLHLFSGPAEREDGMAAYLHAMGIGMHCVDWVNKDTADMDISDDAVWKRFKARILVGVFRFLFAGPPCRTFSIARQVQPGPPPLRDQSHPIRLPQVTGAREGA